jgi:hypothetical protein
MRETSSSDDPVIFAADIFGLTLWRKQREFLRSLVVDQRVAFRSGHKDGKSFVLAVAAWWFSTRGSVLITAPTPRHVRRVWREILRLCHVARTRGHALPEPELPANMGVRLNGDRQIIGLAADVPEHLMGFASPDVLILIDEASGVADASLDAIEGNIAGGAKLGLVALA